MDSPPARRLSQPGPRASPPWPRDAGEERPEADPETNALRCCRADQPPTAKELCRSNSTEYANPSVAYLRQRSSCSSPSQSSRESSPVTESPTPCAPAKPQRQQVDRLPDSSPSQPRPRDTWWPSPGAELTRQASAESPEQAGLARIEAPGTGADMGAPEDADRKRALDSLEAALGTPEEDGAAAKGGVHPFDNVSTLTWRRPDASTGAIPKSSAGPAAARHSVNTSVVGKTRSVKVPRTLSFQQLPQLELAVGQPGLPGAELRGELPESPAPGDAGAQPPALRSLGTPGADVFQPLQIQCDDPLASSADGQLDAPPGGGGPSVDADDCDVVMSDVEAADDVPDYDSENVSGLIFREGADADGEKGALVRRVKEMEQEMVQILNEVEDEFKEDVMVQLHANCLLQLIVEKRLREKAELEEDIQALNDLLKEAKQDKTVKQLKSEIYQLQLACETMIGEIDQFTNGQVPLGETDAESLQNFRAVPASQAGHPKPEVAAEAPEPAASASTGTAAEDVDGGREETELRWCCAKCTYSNHHLMVECEMCATPREQPDGGHAQEDEGKAEADEPVKLQGTNA